MEFGTARIGFEGGGGFRNRALSVGRFNLPTKFRNPGFGNPYAHGIDYARFRRITRYRLRNLTAILRQITRYRLRQIPPDYPVSITKSYRHITPDYPVSITPDYARLPGTQRMPSVPNTKNARKIASEVFE